MSIMMRAIWIITMTILIGISMPATPREKFVRGRMSAAGPDGEIARIKKFISRK